MIYRIYTGDSGFGTEVPDSVHNAIANHFGGYTLEQTRGVWRGDDGDYDEDALVFEIVAEVPDPVIIGHLALLIKLYYEQESVLVAAIPTASVEFI